MPKGSLYSAHRAAGAASGRYKASLYDIANVGYAMEADVGIEQFKQSQTQETFATIGEALGLAETIRGTFQARKDYKEMASKYGLEDTKKTETPKSETPVQPKVPTIEKPPSVTKKLKDMSAGSQERIDEYKKRGWAMDETTKSTKRYAAGAPGTGEIKKPIKQEVHIPTVAEAEKALAGKPGRELKKLQEKLSKMDLPVFD